MKKRQIFIRYKGGAGSGHHGHAGIPGHQGGSLPEGEGSSTPKIADEKDKDVARAAANMFNKSGRSTIKSNGWKNGFVVDVKGFGKWSSGSEDEYPSMYSESESLLRDMLNKLRNSHKDYTFEYEQGENKNIEIEITHNDKKLSYDEIVKLANG